LFILAIIIIHNIIIILFHWPTAFDFNFYFKKYAVLLTESFRVSVTYLKMHTQQIAINQPSLENFLKFFTLEEFRILKEASC